MEEMMWEKLPNEGCCHMFIEFFEHDDVINLCKGKEVKIGSSIYRYHKFALWVKDGA